MTQRKTIIKAQKDVLVALLKYTESLDILLSEGWHHIPVAAYEKYTELKTLAFYQGSKFGADEAYKIHYYGEVSGMDIVQRKELFPNDEKHKDKAENYYYRLWVKPKALPHPILSTRPRRLVFIPTTWEKVRLAEQINDLFDDSPLEDLLWNKFKKLNIQAERQWNLRINNKKFFLDFALFCQDDNKLAVEIDGYTFHHESTVQIDYDTMRQNEIELDKWSFLHYTSSQIMDDSAPYLDQIQEKVEQLGGLESPEKFNRKVGEEAGGYSVEDDDAFI